MITLVFFIHLGHDRYHRAGDNAIPPIATIATGSTAGFAALDAGGGQLTASSGAACLRLSIFR